MQEWRRWRSQRPQAAASQIVVNEGIAGADPESA